MNAPYFHGEEIFTPQKVCIDGICYETFIPSNEYLEGVNCADIISVGKGEVYARVCKNDSESDGSRPKHIVIKDCVDINDVTYRVVAIGENALMPLTEGTSVILPPTIKIIGDNALCAKLVIDDYSTWACHYEDAYVRLPESVVYIGESGLEGVRFDSTLNLPNISFLGKRALLTLCDIKKISLGPQLTAVRTTMFKNVENVEFADGSDDVLYWASGKKKAYLSDWTFGSSTIREIKLPKWNNLVLADCVAEYCDNLERVVFPDVKTIEYGCNQYHFSYAMSYPYYGLFFSECPNLREIVCLGTTPPELLIDYSRLDFDWIAFHGSSETFQFMDNLDECVLKVPAGSEEAYRAAPEWGKFKTIVGFENGDYTSIAAPEVMPLHTPDLTPVYHTLQGIEVTCPIKGQLYIRTVGSRTDKVLY